MCSWIDLSSGAYGKLIVADHSPASIFEFNNIIISISERFKSDHADLSCVDMCKKISSFSVTQETGSGSKSRGTR